MKILELNNEKHNKRSGNLVGFFKKLDKYEKIDLGDIRDLDTMVNMVGKESNDIIPNPPFEKCFFECKIGTSYWGVFVEKDINKDFFDIEICAFDKQGLLIIPAKFRTGNCFLKENEEYKNAYDVLYDGIVEEELREYALYILERGVCRVLASLSIIACSNVELKDNTKYNKTIRRGKVKNGLPLYTYKTLHIKTNKPASKSESLGGTHASPRVHLRRGHIRKLPNGNTTWVQSCVVGTKDNGIVEKDYKVSI